MNAGASYNGYPSSFEDRNLSVSHRDIGPGISPRMPDAGYDPPNSLTRTDGNPVPPAESNILFVDGLPTDCTRREIGRILSACLCFLVSENAVCLCTIFRLFVYFSISGVSNFMSHFATLVQYDQWIVFSILQLEFVASAGAGDCVSHADIKNYS